MRTPGDWNLTEEKFPSWHTLEFFVSRLHPNLFGAHWAETLVAHHPQIILKSASTLEGEEEACPWRRHNPPPRQPSKAEQEGPELCWLHSSGLGAPCCYPHKVRCLGSGACGLHQATASAPGELQPTARLSSLSWEHKTRDPFQQQAYWKFPGIRCCVRWR